MREWMERRYDLRIQTFFAWRARTKTVSSPAMDGMSGKDLVLFLGSLFLLWKSVPEIHGNLEGEEHETSLKVRATMSSPVEPVELRSSY